MKNIGIMIAGIAASAALCGGCSDKAAAAGEKGRVEVVMNALVANSRAVVVPDEDGLPTAPLTIGILTGNYNLDPAATPPGEEDWGIYTYLDRGDFRRVERTVDQTTVVNGEITYTTADGQHQQRVFYDETGMYYILRVIYPYIYTYRGETGDEEAMAGLILSPVGSQVLFRIDGSQDIMSSDLGWGNMNSQGGKVVSGQGTGLRLSHRLVKFDLQVSAEEGAAEQYGQVTSVELVGQPDQAVLNIATGVLASAVPEPAGRYKPVGFPAPLTLPASPDSPIPCGYVMALPATRYTFRIGTQNRLSFYADALFPAGAQAGTAYTITLKFMAAEEVKIDLVPMKHWVIDSSYN